MIDLNLGQNFSAFRVSFVKKFHDWQEFYTTAGDTGRAKYQLWIMMVKW